VTELRTLLEDVKAAAGRARALVDDLKQLGRPGDEDRTLIDLGGLLSVALRLSRPALLLRCQLEVAYTASPRVLANEGRLLQVLLNLLTNAIQAIPPGQASTNHVRASVGTDAEGNALLEISDSGPGVPLELRERVFEPFFTTKPSGVGTGLGLYITRRIVEGIGGRIAVFSSERGGARFVVTCPPASAPMGAVASPAS
jgi:signal transduction histidine kinase